MEQSNPDGHEPELWFHDIFRPDGTPYKEEEIKLIDSLTEKQSSPTPQSGLKQ